MQPVTNKIANFAYEGLLEAELEVIEGFAFIHLKLNNISLSLLKNFRVEFKNLLTVLQAKGFDVLFFTSTNQKTVKLARLISPLFDVRQLEGGIWLGSWLTFEDT